MKTMDYNSIQDIKTLLTDRNLAVNYNFGQNFLINQNARELIIKHLEVENNDFVWEFGPGLGAMTSHLYGYAGKLVLFELDKGYCEILSEFYPDAKIIKGDCVKTMGLETDNPDRVIGNLPYNSASAIILELIRQDICFKKAVFTVQNEMADRLIAKKGSKNYSSFTILSNSFFHINKVSVLKSGSFFPKPRVTSAVITLEIGTLRKEIKDKDFYFHFVKHLFVNRRKTLRNNVKNMIAHYSFLTMSIMEEVFDTVQIDLNDRPETLSPETMIAAANKIDELKGR